MRSPINGVGFWDDLDLSLPDFDLPDFDFSLPDFDLPDFDFGFDDSDVLESGIEDDYGLDDVFDAAGDVATDTASSFDWSGLISDVLPTVISTGTKVYALEQQKDLAEAQAQAQAQAEAQAQRQAQLDAARAAQQQAAAAAQAAAVAAAAQKQANETGTAVAIKHADGTVTTVNPQEGMIAGLDKSTLFNLGLIGIVGALMLFKRK